MTNNDIFTPTETVISPEAMLAHWQGHRRLTRRVIEAFRKISSSVTPLAVCVLFPYWYWK